MRRLFYIVPVALILFSSCKKLELDKISSSFWNPKLATPIVYGDFTIKDILAKADTSDLIQNKNGVLSIVYNTNFSSLNASSFVKLADFSTSQNIVPSKIADIGIVPAPFNIIPKDTVISTTDNQVLDFPVDQGVEIDSITFKGGSMDIALATNLKHNIDLTVTLPDFKVNNVALTKKLSVKYTNGTPLPNTTTLSIPLENSVADFTANGTGINKIRINTTAKLTGTGQSVSGNEFVNLNVALNSLQFKTIKGYFGKIDVAGASDSVSLDLFKNATKGVFGLTNPTVKFIVENSFGFPAQLNILDLHTKETGTNTINQMVPNKSTIDLNYPLLSEMGEYKKTEIILNKTNTSNIDALVTSIPKYFYFGAGAKANPLGNLGKTNFIQYTDSLKVKVEAELPLEGYAYGFELGDTLDANDSFKNLNNTISSLLFRLEVENGFPLDVDCQVSFLDENYKLIKDGSGKTIELLKTSSSVLKSGVIDNAGKVTSSTKTTTDISLAANEIPYLSKAKYVLISGDLETHDGKNKKAIQLYETYKISLKLSMQVEGGVKVPSVN